MTRRRRKRLTRAPVRRLRRAKLVWERNLDRREVSKTSESIEKNEILEKAASKRKEEIINKHDTDKEKGGHQALEGDQEVAQSRLQGLPVCPEVSTGEEAQGEQAAREAPGAGAGAPGGFTSREEPGPI